MNTHLLFASPRIPLILLAQMKQTPQQAAAEQAQVNLSNTLTNNLNTTFGESQGINQGLTSQLQNITNRGLAGQGFLPGQEANLRADSKEAAAQSNVTAEQALAAKNGGSPSTSGAVGEEDAQLASAAAQNDANAQRNITAENSKLAQANVTSGLAGLGNLGSELGGSANNFGNSADTSDSNAWKEAPTPSSFWGTLGGDLLGQGLGAAMGAATGGLSSLFSRGGGGGGNGSDGEDYGQ